MGREEKNKENCVVVTEWWKGLVMNSERLNIYCLMAQLTIQVAFIPDKVLKCR